MVSPGKDGALGDGDDEVYTLLGLPPRVFPNNAVSCLSDVEASSDGATLFVLDRRLGAMLRLTRSP
jgi:hypothetical protein